MAQEIIVYIILAITTGLVTYKAFNKMIKKPAVEKTSACGGCTGCAVKKSLDCSK